MLTQEERSQVTQEWVWQESLRCAYRNLIHSGYNPSEAISEVFNAKYISLSLKDVDYYADTKHKKRLMRSYSYQNGVRVAKELRAKFLEALSDGEEL